MADVHGPQEKEVPATECLKDTVERFLPWWNSVCAPAIKSGKKVRNSAVCMSKI